MRLAAYASTMERPVFRILISILSVFSRFFAQTCCTRGASIIPIILGGHSQAKLYALAEHLASMIIEG